MMNRSESLLTLLPSLLEAARTIACDIISLIFEGFKLQSTQTIRFCPETTVISINEATHTDIGKKT